METPNLISRAEAIEKLSTLWEEQRSRLDPKFQKRLQGGGNWERLRNYELEWELYDLFDGDDWVVNEWCPFNGVYCRALGYINVDLIHKTIEELGKSSTPHLRAIRILEKELARREEGKEHD